MMIKELRILIPINILLVTIAFSCNREYKVDDINRCQEDFNMANSNLNSYYIDSSRNHLDSALFYVDRVSFSCPEFKTRFTNLKLSILLLLKDGNKGYDFVRSLDSTDFDKIYKKEFYLSNFIAITYENQGNKAKRDEEYLKLSTVIEKYIQKKSEDKQAYMDLFYTNVKFKGKEQVLREIDSIYKNKINDINFIESVKQTIESLPE